MNRLADTATRVPVLIAGGSLVGLSASLFLGRLEIGHLLVEKHPRTSHHPRGRGNNIRTMELYRTAGVESAIREAGSIEELERLRVRYLGRKAELTETLRSIGDLPPEERGRGAAGAGCAAGAATGVGRATGTGVAVGTGTNGP